MRVRHPYALDDDAPEPDDTVHWGGRREWSDVDDDGAFHVPDDRAEQFVDEWPDADGYDLADLVVGDNGAPDRSESETCDEIVQSTGEVCGRDLPCPYHSEG